MRPLLPRNPLLLSSRRHASRLRARLDIPPPFPVTETCPENCCATPTPAMPEGLPIDYEQPLNGTMAAYAQQLLICTGQRDWTSRIEDDGKGEGQVWGDLARGLRKLMGRGGRFADVYASGIFFFFREEISNECSRLIMSWYQTRRSLPHRRPRQASSSRPSNTFRRFRSSQRQQKQRQEQKQTCQRISAHSYSPRNYTRCKKQPCPSPNGQTSPASRH